jgi:hypothetical protein
MRAEHIVAYLLPLSLWKGKPIRHETNIGRNRKNGGFEDVAPIAEFKE